MGPLARLTENAEIFSAALCSSPWLLPWCTSASMDTWMEISANPIELLIKMGLSVETLEVLLRLFPIPIFTTQPLMIFRIDIVLLNVPTSVEDLSQLSPVMELPAIMQWQLILQEHTLQILQLQTSLATTPQLSLAEFVFPVQLSSQEHFSTMFLLLAPTFLKMDSVLSSLISKM